MKSRGLITSAAAVAALGFLPTATAVAAEGESKVEVYGFAQGDYIQDANRVDPAWLSTLRPSRIPTTPGTFGSDGQADLSARQSRLGVTGSFPVQEKTLKTKFEFDMFGVGVDEGQTTIRLRHAYGEWGAWLAGQTHSLFMDIDVFPNVLDYWGPAGIVFYRNVQLRYTPCSTANHMLAFAIERPTTDIDPGQIRQLAPELGANIKADQKVPDFTASYRSSGAWGHVQLSGIVRRIGFETLGNETSSPRGFKMGWGGDLTANIKYGEGSKIILAAIYGRGIASYMNDGGTDLGPEGVPGALTPRAVPLYAGAIYFDHYWTEKWGTTFGYSRTQVENTSFQAGNAFFRGEYASANLTFTPDKKFLVGGELLWGRKTDNSGATGHDLRTQVTFRYSFSSKI